MEYHIGMIKGTENFYLTDMRQDVVIIDYKTVKVKYTFKTGVANGSSIVAIFK